MVEGGGGARFPLEALERLPVLREILREELERDGTSKTGVLGAVDDAHAAAADVLEDSVVRNRLARLHVYPPGRACPDCRECAGRIL
jgi:hypothetical protein